MASAAQARSAATRSEGPELAALGAVAFLAVVTAGWWAFALWPVSEQPAAWLARARAVCFNVGPSGLPDASGWLVFARAA